MVARPVYRRAMTHARRLPLALGTVVAAVVLALLSLGGGPRSAGSAVTVPDRLADYSYLTGDVSDAPPGRAVALYQHGFGDRKSTRLNSSHPV